MRFLCPDPLRSLHRLRLISLLRLFRLHLDEIFGFPYRSQLVSVQRNVFSTEMVQHLSDHCWPGLNKYGTVQHDDLAGQIGRATNTHDQQMLKAEKLLTIPSEAPPNVSSFHLSNSPCACASPHRITEILSLTQREEWNIRGFYLSGNLIRSLSSHRDSCVWWWNSVHHLKVSRDPSHPIRSSQARHWCDHPVHFQTPAPRKHRPAFYFSLYGVYWLCVDV